MSEPPDPSMAGAPDPLRGPSTEALLAALGLVLLVADDAGELRAASPAAARYVAEPAVRAAALALAARARREASAVASAIRAGDRDVVVEARRLDATRVVVSVCELGEARRRLESIATGAEEAARALVVAALEPLVRDPASEALTAIRAANEAIEQAREGSPAAAPLDAVASAVREAEARIRKLLAAARAEPSDGARTRAPFDVEALVAAVVACHRPAYAGRGRLLHSSTAARWALGDLGLVERGLGLFLEWIALRLDPEHALDNGVTVAVGEAQGRPHVEIVIVAHLRTERAALADDFLNRALGAGTVAFLAARALVEASGGELDRATDPAGRLAFRLSFSPAAAAAPVRVERPARRARVLAIDDEPMLVVAYQRMMRKTHDVVPVVGGVAALELLGSDRAFDVILCDLVMPQVSGIDVYRSVEASYPELTRRFIFLSGGAYTPSARSFLESTGARCLDKPVEVPTLISVISEALAARDGEPGSS